VILVNENTIGAKMAISQRASHPIRRLGWLRAAVLGANDGIVSTASLIVGVAAASGSRSDVLIAGIAGLVAGSMSMAAGEYVSVSSLADTEKAALARQRKELVEIGEVELEELAAVFETRGIEPGLAKQVAQQLMKHDADVLAAHAGDEFDISETISSRPVQAAIASAASFATGAAVQIITVLLVPQTMLVPAVSVMSLLFLAVLGALAAKVGGASLVKSTIRVAFWGALAMGLTAVVGSVFGTVV
jgi:VIT1/CCC1 family predicted Fe2+/Mn2+ transporter